MANYLRFAGAVLDEIESGLSTRRIILQLNAAKCKRLLGNLRKTHDHFYQSLLFPTRTLRQKCFPFYKEFYRIVEHTEAIVKECSKPDWLEAAIMQAGNQEVFIQMSRKLHFCINGFTQTLEPFLDICSNFQFTALSVTVEQHERDEDYCQDSLKFMERLKEVVNQQVSEDTITDPWKHQLAEYLIERENYMSSTNLDLCTSLPQFYVAKREYPRVGEPIGSGSAGSVLKVHWLGLECAKKHFATNPDKSNSPRKLELMKEVSALVHLNHPHIVKLLCVSMEGEVSFLMELMPMSLHNFIRKRWKGQKYIPFTLAAATDIMLQIALGMEYLHGKGVVHRDLKSQNILVTPSACEGLSDEGYGNIKVTDFGLSKTLTHELTEPTGILGTARWMAPEVLRLKEGLKPKIDWRKADTYSFAMTCSEILTGATPFSEGDCRTAMLYERITKGGERPKLLLACPKFLASFLTQCWHTNPALRPSFTEICNMLQLLQGFLFRGSDLIHRSWSLAETSSLDQTSTLRRATGPEQDIIINVGLSSLKELKLDRFFRSSKIFRSQLISPQCDGEVLSSILMGNFPQPVGLRGVQVFDFNSSLNYESRKELELRTMAKCRYFVEGMKALTDNPRNHLVKLQYWHYASFRQSKHNRLYVVHDAWASTLDEHLSGLKKTLPWNTRLHILTGFMACVVYFIELIELNVIRSISLSTKSILLDKSYNLQFTDVSLVHDARYVKATNGDNLKGMVYKIGIFIMEVLGGIRKHDIDTSDQYATGEKLTLDPQWVHGFIDPRLNTGYHTGQAGTLLTLSLMCTHPNEHARPTIWSARDIITSTADMATKLTPSQDQGQFSALDILEYNRASETTCQEVRDITSNFSTPKGYGKYPGILSNGEKVLVDQLHPSSASPKEFIDQVKMYKKVPTCGLVMNPIGFCVEEGERILIYRDMETVPAQVYLEDNAKVSLFTTKPQSIALQIARGLNSLCNMGIVLHNTTLDNIHVTRNGCVMFGLQFEEENSLTKSEKLSKQMEDFGTILGQLVCGPKWQSSFGTPMHLKNMAVHIEQFVHPGFLKFNNLAMSQLAMLASLCLEEGHARLSMVDVIQKLEGVAKSWRAHAGTLELISSYENVARKFTLHELDATNENFGLERLPGEGESGWMRLEAKLERSGFRQVLAMRQLDRNGFQGYQEPLVEALLQSLSYHRNLVNLIGYGADNNRLFLLYDCAPSSFLKDRLYDLDWVSRMRIAYGVARGLEYLHDKASPPVICGNLNSSKVLLDCQSYPKLNGFRLADMGPPGSKNDVNGNDGYCAPECVITGQFTFKSDVYSFGMVLLELITERRAIDNARAAGEQNLVAWARPFFEDSHEIFPSILNPELLACTLDLAAQCLEQDAVARPPIKDVVSKMEDCMAMEGFRFD